MFIFAILCKYTDNTNYCKINYSLLHLIVNEIWAIYIHKQQNLYLILRINTCSIRSDLSTYSMQCKIIPTVIFNNSLPTSNQSHGNIVNNIILKSIHRIKKRKGQIFNTKNVYKTLICQIQHSKYVRVFSKSESKPLTHKLYTDTFYTA